MEVRLQKYMADCGVASRRKCEEYILEGKVKINGIVIKKLGTKVIIEKDVVEYDSKVINSDKKFVYVLLNKPIGYLTTLKDQFSRRTILDLVKIKQRIVPVGRLDMNTSGAIILTNDGDLVYKITHPKHEIEKTYIVTLKGIITNNEIEQLRKGVNIEDYITKTAKVKVLSLDKEKDTSELEIIIREGKNRQIRKMCEIVNRKVLALHRSKIGNIRIDDLESGKWRYLDKQEVEDCIEGRNKTC